MVSESLDNKINEQGQLDIVRFTIKSFFWVVVVGVLLAASFLNFFNYPAMKFYTGLNNKTRALESAESYLKGSSSKIATDALPAHDSKYADALLCAVNNSISLMNSESAKLYDGKHAKKFAEKVEKYTSVYLSYNVAGSMGERSRAIDIYNLAHTTPDMHPSLVSFSDSLAVKQAKARLILGQDDLLNADCLQTTSKWANEDWQASHSDNKIANSNFVMLDKLNQYFARELALIGFYKLPKAADGTVKFSDIKANIVLNGKTFELFINASGEFTKLYNLIDMRFDDIKDYIKLNAKKDSAAEQLRFTYYLKIMTEFARNMEYFSMVMGANAELFNANSQETLINLYKNVWEPHAIAEDVQIYDDGHAVTKSVPLNKWYLSGVFIDYLLLYVNG